jgi:hypothetical protein
MQISFCFYLLHNCMCVCVFLEVVSLIVLQKRHATEHAFDPKLFYVRACVFQDVVPLSLVTLQKRQAKEHAFHP